MKVQAELLSGLHISGNRNELESCKSSECLTIFFIVAEIATLSAVIVVADQRAIKCLEITLSHREACIVILGVPEVLCLLDLCENEHIIE